MVTIYDDQPDASCLGWYQIDEQLGLRQLTYLCPCPPLLCCAGWQSQGIQTTLK